MHEFGLCDAILAATLKRADGRRVHRARVRVGGHPVDPAVINHGVQVAAVGTVAEGMEVDVVLEPTVLICRSCGHRTDANDALAMIACRRCGGFDIDADGSENVVLESITIDDSSGEVQE